MSIGTKVLNFYSFNKCKIEEDTIKKIDKTEFIKLIEENKLPVYRLAKSIVKNEHDVQDVVNEAIVKAYENLERLKSRESFKSWLMRILVNECYTLLNRKKKIKLEENMAVYNICYKESDSYELMCEVEKLKLEFRTVLILFYYEDMSIKSISEVLSISQGTVKSRLSRAKAKLKTILEESEGGI
ncbi:RNA polymerase sigma factor [Clostridium gasigenes]|uniref:RNA polymerase sigma factor n=1 Tax=Clostridium gasigenes TaxID=94869 RepID=UPI001C0D5DA2|nr:sigma-70 family RNA polymerase sigma factor [Clostridium gasigenes]MBU3105100.1 sigma-70 family RNA polymerase sigma factor [Clostridium gasigenes]